MNSYFFIILYYLAIWIFIFECSRLRHKTQTINAIKNAFQIVIFCYWVLIFLITGTLTSAIKKSPTIFSIPLILLIFSVKFFQIKKPSYTVMSKECLRIYYLNMFESFAVCILSSLAIGFIKNIYQLSGSIYFDELKELILQREYAGKTEFIYSFSTNYFLPALLPSLYIFYAFIKYSRSTLYIRYINININLDYRMLSIINIFFVVVAFYSTIKTTGSSVVNRNSSKVTHQKS